MKFAPLMALCCVLMSSCSEKYKLYETKIEGRVIEVSAGGLIATPLDGHGSRLELSFVLYDKRAYDKNPKEFVVGGEYIFYVKKTREDVPKLAIVLAEEKALPASKGRADGSGR